MLIWLSRNCVECMSKYKMLCIVSDVLCVICRTLIVWHFVNMWLCAAEYTFEIAMFCIDCVFHELWGVCVCIYICVDDVRAARECVDRQIWMKTHQNSKVHKGFYQMHRTISSNILNQMFCYSCWFYRFITLLNSIVMFCINALCLCIFLSISNKLNCYWWWVRVMCGSKASWDVGESEKTGLPRMVFDIYKWCIETNSEEGQWLLIAKFNFPKNGIRQDRFW